YAKESPDEILIRISVCNRSKEAASLHVLPTLWFRNTWTWSEGQAKPSLEQAPEPKGMTVITASHPELGTRYLWCEGEVPLLFTENETNMERVFRQPNQSPYVKDGIHQYLVHNDPDAVNPLCTGTKASALYQINVAGGATHVIRLRLSAVASPQTAGQNPGSEFKKRFEEVLKTRQQEADEFYDAIAPPSI